MNKNTLLAFVLIAFTVIFFNSDFWNRTILKRPVPANQSQQRAANAADNNDGHAETSAAAGGTANNITGTAEITAPSTAHAQGDSLYITDGDNDSALALLPPLVADTIVVETNRLIAAFTTQGARIISLKMKDYNHSGTRADEMIDLITDGNLGGAQLSINNESFDDRFFTVTGAAGHDLVFETKASDGRPLQKIFSFSDDTYRIGYTVRGDGVAGQKVTIGWAGGIGDAEGERNMPFGGNIDKRRAHYSDGYTVNHFEMRRRGVESPSGLFRWVGMSSKYFFVAVVADRMSDADIKIEARDVTVRPPNQRPSREVDIDYSVFYQFEAESSEVESWIYAGPGRIGEMSRHDMKFEKTLFPVLSWARHILWAGAWFPPLAEIILKILLFLYGLVKDYGFAIFFLTLLSKIVTFPMTQSSARSMNRMRELQPKIMALRQKHKSNPQKMNQEMMALYKAEGVNPLNPGCLPMFLQMPIFIALFVVLRKAIELRGASSFLLPWVSDLSQPEALFYLPGNGLPIYGANVALMPIIMAALTFFQQRQMMQDPNQKAMLYMMPIIMLVMFNSFPAGVVFYWTVSSALGLVQQKWLKPQPKSKPGPTATVTMATAGGGTTTVKAPVKKSGGGGSGKRKRR
ncbi:MAG: membrane protein insertase YidC [Chitinispirillales bacterium]|nr:membrane protein insertase YidC [Chitinispirillales bacterium]